MIMRNRLRIYTFNSDTHLRLPLPPKCWAPSHRFPMTSHLLFTPNPGRWVINLHFTYRKLRQRKAHLVNCPR